jgi:ABC-type transport system involved in multi-copper enzyme maturation permease subunit
MKSFIALFKREVLRQRKIILLLVLCAFVISTGINLYTLIFEDIVDSSLTIVLHQRDGVAMSLEGRALEIHADSNLRIEIEKRDFSVPQEIEIITMDDGSQHVNRMFLKYPAIGPEAWTSDFEDSPVLIVLDGKNYEVTANRIVLFESGGNIFPIDIFIEEDNIMSLPSIMDIVNNEEYPIIRFIKDNHHENPNIIAPGSLHLLIWFAMTIALTTVFLAILILLLLITSLNREMYAQTIDFFYTLPVSKLQIVTTKLLSTILPGLLILSLVYISFYLITLFCLSIVGQIEVPVGAEFIQIISSNFLNTILFFEYKVEHIISGNPWVVSFNINLLYLFFLMIGFSFLVGLLDRKYSFLTFVIAFFTIAFLINRIVMDPFTWRSTKLWETILITLTAKKTSIWLYGAIWNIICFSAAWLVLRYRETGKRITF